MKLFAIFFLTFVLSSKFAQSAYCNYRILDAGYGCDLSAYYEDITEIRGKHDDFHSDTDKDVEVIRYEDLYIKNFPPVICDKFKNLKQILFTGIDLHTIDENALSKCNKLTFIDFPQNKLTKLPANVFASQSKLDTLYLYDNLIEELPANIFVPLKSLRVLSLNNNRLTTLNSDSFGALPKFKEFFFHENLLTSFDEQIVENNQKLDVINGGKNNCTGNVGRIEGRGSIKRALKICFANYVQ